jgi:hypothetical protein
MGQTTLTGIIKSAEEPIFGSPDDLKLMSCATLFASVSPNRRTLLRCGNCRQEETDADSVQIRSPRLNQGQKPVDQPVGGHFRLNSRHCSTVEASSICSNRD